MFKDYDIMYNCIVKFEKFNYIIFMQINGKTNVLLLKCVDDFLNILYVKQRYIIFEQPMMTS